MKTPEINLNLTTVEVKGGKSIKLTVRNCFYKGFWGKIRTIWCWIIYNRNKTFKEHLDSPVKYITEMGEIYYNPAAIKELYNTLINESNRNTST